MKQVRLLNGSLWTANVGLGGAVVVFVFHILFPANPNPLSDVVLFAAAPGAVKAAPPPNFTPVRNFQNPVIPREASSGVAAASDIKADLLGTVTSAVPTEIVAYLAIPGRNLHLNAYYDEPVGQDGSPVPELAGWKLVSVTSDSATFSNGTRETTLVLKEAAIGTAGLGPGGMSSSMAALAGTVDKPKVTKIASTNDSETYSIDKASIAWVTANQDAILGEITLQDYASGGIQITSLAPGSLAEQFGLKANDVVRSVNGQPIPNSLALADLRNSDVIKKATTLTLGVERAGLVRALVIRSTK